MCVVHPCVCVCVCVRACVPACLPACLPARARACLQQTRSTFLPYRDLTGTLLARARAVSPARLRSRPRPARGPPAVLPRLTCPLHQDIGPRRRTGDFHPPQLAPPPPTPLAMPAWDAALAAPPRASVRATAGARGRAAARPTGGTARQRQRQRQRHGSGTAMRLGCTVTAVRIGLPLQGTAAVRPQG